MMLGARVTSRTKVKATARSVRRINSAWVSAIIRFVVTTRDPPLSRARSALATLRCCVGEVTASTYHALVSTNNSAGTLSSSAWLPRFFFGVGEVAVVFGRHVVAYRHHAFSRSDTNNSQSRMFRRVRQLPL